MRSRPARLVLHGGAATVLAAVAVVATGGPGSAADAARPDSFGGDATASAIHYLADRNPQPTPVTDAFHAELPYATTSLDSSGSISATAASLYPGGGLLGVPALLCQFGAPGAPVQPCQVASALPRYPVMATASYPVNPDDQADAPPPGTSFVQGPLTVDPSLTTAHAKADSAEARTVAGKIEVAPQLSVGSASSHSQQHFEGSTLVVTADTAVHDLDLAGGALHIGSITSTAVAKVDGGKVSSSSAVTTITGATASGHPVTIDSSGVHVDSAGDSGVLNDQANTALAALDASGFKIRLLAPTKSAKTGTAAAATGGLLVGFNEPVDLPAVPVPNVPSVNGDYVGSFTIGGAGVTAFATPATDFSIGTPTLPSVGGVVPPGGKTVSMPAVGAPQSAPGPAVAPQAAGAPPAVAGSPATKPTAVLGIDLTSKRLKTLALVLLGYPILVLLTAPLRAPARLPKFL